MNNSIRSLAPLIVSAVLLSACNGRMILHGSKIHRRSPIVAAVETVTGAGPKEPVEKNGDVGVAAPEHTAPGRLKVWFVKSQPSGFHFVCVERKPMVAKDAIEQAVGELLDGPSADEARQGCGSEIPGGTILIGVRHLGNDVELNLSRRFANDGGTTSFETRLEQLRRTVAAVSGKSNVYLDVEGRRLNVEEGEGIEVPQPIVRPRLTARM